MLFRLQQLTLWHTILPSCVIKRKKNSSKKTPHYIMQRNNLRRMNWWTKSLPVLKSFILLWYGKIICRKMEIKVKHFTPHFTPTIPTTNSDDVRIMELTSWHHKANSAPYVIISNDWMKIKMWLHLHCDKLTHFEAYSMLSVNIHASPYFIFLSCISSQIYYSLWQQRQNNSSAFVFCLFYSVILPARKHSLEYCSFHSSLFYNYHN